MWFHCYTYGVCNSIQGNGRIHCTIVGPFHLVYGVVVVFLKDELLCYKFLGFSYSVMKFHVKEMAPCCYIYVNNRVHELCTPQKRTLLHC